MSADELDRWCDANADRCLEELIEALRIPSISAQPEHAADVRRNAEHFAEAARRTGFTTVEIWDTDGHPAVFAERIVDPQLPTVLVYGHHDVQPVDPLDEWVSPPFEPEVRDGRLHARGAVDDKGQVWMHLKAVEAQLAVNGELPLNARLIIEGEEEIGSVHFAQLLERRRDRLACDVCVVSDTEMPGKGRPSITVGLRGLVDLEVEVTGPAHDLHSGAFGGAVANPAEQLARIIASLKDPASERILVPGFYDAVEDLSDADRERLSAGAPDDAQFLSDAGDAPAPVGESGYTSRERVTIRPTLEINGIWGGYSGAGSKTIVPARAAAKITCRLVPNQRPEEIAEKVKAAIEAAASPGVRVTVRRGGGGSQPVVVATDHPAIRAASTVLRDVFGAEPLYMREGGSIPPVEMFARVLGVTTVMVGVGLPDDNYHAPNESFDVEQFRAGTRAIARLWDELATALRPATAPSR